jgi:hypothetical protein
LSDLQLTYDKLFQLVRQGQVAAADLPAFMEVMQRYQREQHFSADLLVAFMKRWSDSGFGATALKDFVLQYVNHLKFYTVQAKDATEYLAQDFAPTRLMRQQAIKSAGAGDSSDDGEDQPRKRRNRRSGRGRGSPAAGRGDDRGGRGPGRGSGAAGAGNRGGGAAGAAAHATA